MSDKHKLSATLRRAADALEKGEESEIEALHHAFKRLGPPESSLILHFDGRVEYRDDWDVETTKYENAAEALEDFRDTYG